MYKRGAFVIGLVLVGFCCGGGTHAATKRTGPIRMFSGKEEIVEACTTATAYTPLPAMRQTFTLGGTAPAAVVVLFQGAFSLSGTAFDTGFVQLQIDGVTQSPGEIPIKNEGALTATHGFQWPSAPLAPGAHTARIQWRTDLGSNFCVDARSLLILHR